MKTAHVVTYHNSNSYGACLQAYATYILIEQLGYQVKFINYRNRVEQENSGKSGTYFLRRKMYQKFVKTAVQNILGYRHYLNKAYSDFHGSLPTSSDAVFSIERLANQSGDLLVVGSDQMWNPELSGGLDPVFLLQFGKYRKRISLSTSMGNHELSKEEAEQFRSALDNFDAVSVREKFAADQLASIGVNAFCCLDPTLLIGADTWRSFAKKPDNIDNNTNYLLYFTLRNRDSQKDKVCLEYAKMNKLPVWKIANNRLACSRADRYLRGVTPEEFVWLVDNASLVVTDSFHGTAFSVSLDTPFVVLPNSTGNNVRMLDLLSKLNLNARFDGMGRDDERIKGGLIEYHHELNEERSRCLDWLANAIK